MFFAATILVAKGRVENYDYYPIGNLESPSVQRRLSEVEEYQYLKIANLGLLFVTDVTYTRVGGIVLTCRKVKKYEKGFEPYGKKQVKKKATV
jgi:hypothetical protein